MLIQPIVAFATIGCIFLWYNCKKNDKYLCKKTKHLMIRIALTTKYYQ
jgi:hypothetical protein